MLYRFGLADDRCRILDHTVTVMFLCPLTLCVPFMTLQGTEPNEEKLYEDEEAAKLMRFLFIRRYYGRRRQK